MRHTNVFPPAEEEEQQQQQQRRRHEYRRRHSSCDRVTITTREERESARNNDIKKGNNRLECVSSRKKVPFPPAQCYTVTTRHDTTLEELTRHNTSSSSSSSRINGDNIKVEGGERKRRIGSRHCSVSVEPLPHRCRFGMLCVAVDVSYTTQQH